MAASKPCDTDAPLGKHSATTDAPLEKRRDAPLKRRATTAAATNASPAAATPAAPLQTTAPAAANATAPLRRQTTTETHGGASVAALFAGGWVAGAAAELLYAHPLGTAVAVSPLLTSSDKPEEKGKEATAVGAVGIYY